MNLKENCVKRLWKLPSKVFKCLMMSIAKFIRKCSNVSLVDPSGQRKKTGIWKKVFAFTEYHLYELKYIICHCQSLIFVIMKSKKKKKKLLQPFHSDDGCFGLIGDQIAPFTIYFFRNWQYLCVFLSSCPRSLVFLLWQTRSLRLQSAWRWSYKITSRLSLKSLRLRARNTLLNR